ncbi:MAG: transglycosylase domain-containing protein, partial [Caulobacterales bacterium]|nr:transglycosylase domain-containing protein [Caulobacterales bacterium]
MKKAYRADLMTDKAKARQKKQMVLGLSMGAILGGLAFFSIVTFNYFFGDLPKINSEQELWVANRPTSFEVVDKDGNTIAYRGPRFGRKVSIDTLPKHVIQAFLAVEDARFFEHSGVDFWGVARAAFENLIAGHTVQGASTITQQLVKNVYLSPKQTFKRKIQEMVLAWQIDNKYPKKEILEVYLNRIYFGQNAYGLEAATWHYFSKRPQELSLAQAAMLAGLPKAPGRLSLDLNAPASIE